MPYRHAAMLLMVIAFVVGIFYSLDALHGERRDRSILFWKSLPVSGSYDRALESEHPSRSSAGCRLRDHRCPATHHATGGRRSPVAGDGAGCPAAWTRLPLFQMELVFLYSLTVLALWHAPLYGWLLLVSGWARRATFLWAVLPPLRFAVFERIPFPHFVCRFPDARALDWIRRERFRPQGRRRVAIDAHFIPLTQLAPGRKSSSSPACRPD